MANWLALKVRIDCPECGSAILLDGPYKRARCTACDASVPMAGVWNWVIERARERGAGGRHFRLATLTQMGVGAIGNIYVGLNKGQSPICAACDAELPGIDGVAEGTDGAIHCGQCGAACPTWPAPGYLEQAKVSQVFCAPPEADPAPPPAPAQAPPRPVVFECPNCGAKLKITEETARVCTCQYCDVDAYLPAELWNKLHPVRRRRAFWLRMR